MEAKELRIGNYVYLELGLPSLAVHEVKAADFVAIDDERVQPIPLTKEWLEKFGFSTHNYHDGVLIFIKDKLEFWEQQVEIWLENPEIKAEIKYIHQLQNLYFALTGEELT